MPLNRIALLSCCAGLCLGLLALAPTNLDASPNPAKRKLLAAQDVSQAAKGRNPVPQLAIQIRNSADIDSIKNQFEATSNEPIGRLSGWYLLRFADLIGMEEAIESLAGDARIAAYARQYQSTSVRKTNDPLFNSQFHLKNNIFVNQDLNVEPAWQRGLTGDGVVVGVLDDGVEVSHEDLVANTNLALSRDFLGNDADPSPVVSDDDHGTAVAGLITASADNALGGAGGAFDAQLAALRMLGSGQTDALEAVALGYLSDSIDIYSNSWGPSDDGEYHPKAGLAANAIKAGVLNGRNGLGSIYVWAGGNGGNSDWSNLDGFANMPETIAVGAIKQNGLQANYSELGANVFCVAPGGNGDVVTTDRSGPVGYNNGALLADDNYTNDFSGTSAATPMVSSVIALMLEANPLLSWRDVQHVLARSCRKVDTGDPDWRTNSAGFEFNHAYGFGLADADAATLLAEQWKAIGPRRSMDSAVDFANVPIPDNDANGLVRTITFDPLLYLEHVQLDFISNHVLWGDLEITLTSPDGTVSQFTKRTSANGPSGNRYQFTSLHFWGEESNGTWTLKVIDRANQDVGDLVSWKLTFFGTDEEISTTGGVPPTATGTNLTEVEAGSTLLINGINLSNAEVEVGGVPATILSNTTNQIEVMLSPGTPIGAQQITITTASGTSTLMVNILPLPPGASIGNSSSGGGGCALSGIGEEIPRGLALLILLMMTALAWQRRETR